MSQSWLLLGVHQTPAQAIIGLSSLILICWTVLVNHNIQSFVLWADDLIAPYPSLGTNTCRLYSQKHVDHHKLPQKLNQLFVLASSPGTSKQSLLLALESFDKVKVEGMKYTEHHCCCLNMGSLQFSPKLNLWQKRCLLWQLVLR